MAETVPVSFRDQDSELLDWIEKQVENGTFRNRSAAIVYAIRMLRHEGDDVRTLT